jgi:chemosensory pili system protein ChpA (sensor histidine kinase/response regulator)
VDEQSDTFAVESAATTDEMPLQDVGADVAEQAVEHADPDLPATGDAQETGGFAIELESQVSPPHERAPVEDIPELSRDDSVSQDTEHESDIAAQQAETQAEQIEDEDDGLAVIGDELDEEILEIFIEEAEEEIASINEQLPVWIKDHENADALATIRRSYHTLKGSGRLVGAMRIGEFAWAHENMLNRVIDGTVAISPALTGLLESACVALPELVQQIKDGTPTRQPIASLMRCADAISKGEQPPTAAAPTPEPADEVSPVSVDEAFLEPELELDQVTLPIDESVEEYNVAEDGGAGAGEAAGWTEEPAVSDGVMDSMLYEIFSTEARGHLEVVQDFLSKAADGEPIVDEPLARALHTLHGSAHMAEAGMIADLAGGLERFVKALMGASQTMPDSGCGALQESAEMIDGMLSHLPDEIVKPEGYDELLGRIRSLYESVPLPSVTETDSELLEEGLHGADGDADELQVEEVSVQELAGVSDDPYAEFDQELLEIFLEEGEGNLETSESALHRWRENRHDSEALAELQRALHTLKGGARMAELNPIGDLAHAVESLIIAIAEGRAGAGHAALDGAQHAQDRLISMLEDVREHRPVQAADSLVSELENLREQAPEEPSAVAPVDAIAIEDELHEQPADVEPLADARSGTVPQSEDPYAEADPELLEIFLEEATDILGHSEETLQSWKQSPDEKPLMAELQRELHTLKGGARMADITEIGDLAHAVESLMVKVADDEVAAGPAMFGVLEQAHDTLVTMVERVRKHQRLEAESGLVAKLEALREGKGLAEEAETTVPESAAKADEQTAEVIALEAGKVHKERRTGSRASQELVRVKAKLLDNMVNFAGEVSIYRSRLEQQVGAYRFNLIEMEQTVSRLREQLRKLEIETEAQVLYRYEKEGDSVGEDFDPLEMDRYSHMQQLSRSLVESVSDLSSIQNLLDNITRESETLLLQQSRVNTELQEGLMRTRMVPFLGLAARMRRIVRQTGQELGKKAELELSGAEGEMDRTVVDRIIAPIEHMLRNAISHGIESPDKRRAAGKPEFGTIKITLERESSDVVLRISDDGAGMHLDAIRNKAIERGLMEADSGLTDNEVLQFILETGFSTAEKVTQVAGRGVGMDVVNSEVKQLGGSLHIDSEAGKGTTFTVRLPFTLALNQALLIEVGDDTYAIPLSSIEGIVRMRREDLKAYYDDPEARFDYGGFQYEVRHLGSVLGTGKPYLDSGPKRIPVLLARIGDHCVAFQVENLLGSREIVVKSVGPQISTVRGVSGATILGDGRVVMILDVAAMLRSGLSHAMAQVEDMIHQPVQTEGLTVMVVDDSITVRKVTTRLLERNDMNVIAAKDGVDAVSKLQERIPDIMLLDIEMPRMDGFELATHVRNEARLRHIPIIMITSRTGDKHRQRAMQIGVNRYLGKPFQEAELLENIQALLEDKNVNA